MRPQNGIGMEFSGLICGKNLKLRNFKLRKIIHYLLEVLAGTIKNLPQMWEYRKQRNLKLGFCSITYTYYLLHIPQ
jgi:hypothetical protein